MAGFDDSLDPVYFGAVFNRYSPMKKKMMFGTQAATGGGRFP